jgi:alanyl-tRNA synthetase
MALPPIDLAVFHDNGFVRKQCRVTDLWFWTTDAERTTCGDTSEDEYTFIGKPLIGGFEQRGKALKDAMRSAFLGFFEERGHTSIEPYPVLARWRDDIHLTIASIADFQPHVTSGEVQPPANPLAVSQPCIRLTDVDAVGRSGRHLTTFEMMAHHVFNRPDEGLEIYWMETCVEHCHRMLTETFGIPSSEITYVENPWCGGGNAGAAVEVIVGGLELATLVFMDMEEHPDGDVELKGDRYRVMPLQIIDTGYGLERFCWAAAGTPTIYEAIYPETVSWLKELSGFQEVATKWPELDLDRLLGEMSRLNGIMNIEAGVDGEKLVSLFLQRLEDRGVKVSAEQFTAITEPLANIYAIPDHLHALCNMLGDGLVPSNAKAGYLARMLARRVLRMRDDLSLSVSISELAEHHLDVNLGGHLNKQHREGLLEILALEEERYAEMLRKGVQVIQTQLKGLPSDADTVPDEDLFTLNDSHGLAPDMVIALARKAGWSSVALRTGFSAEMAERHARLAKAAAKDSVAGSPKFQLDVAGSTKLAYYDDVYGRELEANVVACREAGDEGPSDASWVVVLDQTLFYPEGGGQEGDRGHLVVAGESTITVLDTQKQGSLVLHFTDAPVEEGSSVMCVLDWRRRKQLMDHHTAVHIVGGAARRLLGPHIFQAGSHLSVESGRLDITHFHRLTREDLDAMEDMANEVLATVGNTEKSELNRKDADLIHGFDLYQGGAPKGDTIRILKIAEHDTQACGGTHHDEPGQIGSIRVVRSTAVQDGVERLHIVAGDAALAYARSQDELVRASAEVFGVHQDDLPKAASRFFKEWKEQRKTIEHLESEIVRLRTSGGSNASTSVDGVRMVVMAIDGDLKSMTTMLKELTLDVNQPTVAVLGSPDGGGKLMIGITEGTVAAERYNAVDLLRSIAHHIKGGGGGRPTFAQGGGSDAEGLDAALDAARNILGA